MWSKRPKPGGKGLRCPISLAYRNHGAKKWKPLISCDRPARLYDCDKGGATGQVVCCKSHAVMYEREGITMRVVDRRKR